MGQAISKVDVIGENFHHQSLTLDHPILLHTSIICDIFQILPSETEYDKSQPQKIQTHSPRTKDKNIHNPKWWFLLMYNWLEQDLLNHCTIFLFIIIVLGVLEDLGTSS